jgi:hypothetical protein
MSFTELDKFVIRSKLRITESTGYVFQFSTICKGLPLNLIFNNLNNSFVNVLYFGTFDWDDALFIKDMIREYLFTYGEI